MIDLLTIVDTVDLIAFAALFGCYFCYLPVTRRIFGDDISTRMKRWRHEWARQALWREERITDVSLIRGLMGGVSFFASTSVLLISGLIALLGAAGAVTGILSQYAVFGQVTAEQFSLKVIALLLLAISAFFKFGWSMRLHSYSSIMLGAIPEPEHRGTDHSAAVAGRLAELSYLASKHYHGGMRAYYLGFSALTWFLSAWLFFPALALVVVVMARRDYMSNAFRLSEPITRS